MSTLPIPFENLDPKLRREMASFLRAQFTPTAFTCTCRGAHESCARAKQDAGTYAEFSTVERIARWLEA